MGFFQYDPRDLHLQLGKQTVLRTLPAREQLALSVQHLGIGHFFGRGDQRQRFGRSGLVVEHHGSFNRVTDRAGDQVQVVIGIDPQRQYPKQRQRHTGHCHGDQRHNQVATADDRTQRRAPCGFVASHGTAGLRRDNCSTLG